MCPVAVLSLTLSRIFDISILNARYTTQVMKTKSKRTNNNAQPLQNMPGGFLVEATSPTGNAGNHVFCKQESVCFRSASRRSTAQSL
jgi:hypothetical protein